MDRVVDAVRGGVANGRLVHQDPLIQGCDVGDVGHAWACLVRGQGDVVDDWTPVLNITSVMNWAAWLSYLVRNVL